MPGNRNLRCRRLIAQRVDVNTDGTDSAQHRQRKLILADDFVFGGIVHQNGGLSRRDETVGRESWTGFRRRRLQLPAPGS